jgi:hypothetical protein
VYRHVRFIYNLEMHKQVDMLCQHRWLNSYATKFLFPPQQASHHSQLGPLPVCPPSSSAPMLSLPRMNCMCWQLGTNQHSYQVHHPCKSIYNYSIPVLYTYILMFAYFITTQSWLFCWVSSIGLLSITALLSSACSSSSVFSMPYVSRFCRSC